VKSCTWRSIYLHLFAHLCWSSRGCKSDNDEMSTVWYRVRVQTMYYTKYRRRISCCLLRTSMQEVWSHTEFKSDQSARLLGNLLTTGSIYPPLPSTKTTVSHKSTNMMLVSDPRWDGDRSYRFTCACGRLGICNVPIARRSE
jgi:hypothetical protein